jgi:prepilin-type N-terminal cleavage/methylation domain-containing protein
MTHPYLKNKLLYLLLKSKAKQSKGFTLIELLVTVVVGSIIVAGLLYVVVELLQVNRREEVLTQTQQDTQRALDYITSDLREAVYVYANPNDVIGADKVNNLPPFGDNTRPILAFWRLDPVEPDNTAFWNKNCETDFPGATNPKQSECDTLKIRQSFYTLVIYLQQNNGTTDPWGGQSRIIRYELPKYSASNVATLTPRRGYWDPTATGNSFKDWKRATAPVAGQNLVTGDTAGTSAVLADYVDTLGNSTATAPTCPTGYTASPPTSNTFYACVSNAATNTTPGQTNQTDQGVNQTVQVFLRGNATANRPGLITTYSEAGRTPTLRAEVLIRGVLDKAGT